MSNKPNIGLFFPVYNDEETVRIVAEKALKVLADISDIFEILIINDGSPDGSGAIADELANEYSQVSVIHHPRNLGYGCALQTGFSKLRKCDWICCIDGDDQYDVYELYHMIKLIDRYDLLVTFRYCKTYSTWRILVSVIYNRLLRFIFRSPFRDISTGMKLVRRMVVDDITLTSSSPFIGAEIVLKAMLKGYHIGEVGISTYPRTFGQSASTSIPNIIGTIKDMMRVRREVFTNKPRYNKEQ